MEIYLIFEVIKERGRPLRHFSTRTSNHKFKNVFLPATSYQQEENSTVTSNKLLVLPTTSVKPTIFVDYSAGSEISPEKFRVEPEPVPEPNCWYVVGAGI